MSQKPLVILCHKKPLVILCHKNLRSSYSVIFGSVKSNHLHFCSLFSASDCSNVSKYLSGREVWHINIYLSHKTSKRIYQQAKKKPIFGKWRKKVTKGLTPGYSLISNPQQISWTIFKYDEVRNFSVLRRAFAMKFFPKHSHMVPSYSLTWLGVTDWRVS